MKKLIACLLAVFYLSASSGMVVNVQYCMDKVASVQVNGLGNEYLCCSDGDKKAGCCSNEVQVVKLRELHHAAFAYYGIDIPVQLFSIPISFLHAVTALPLDKVRGQIADNIPPLGSDSSIHIMNCVFRI